MAKKGNKEPIEIPVKDGWNEPSRPLSPCATCNEETITYCDSCESF